jgi:hypothetical protein
LGGDPLFIDRSMIEAIRPLATAFVEVTASPRALSCGTEGMVFDPMEVSVAAGMMGPMAHQEVAAALSPVLLQFMGARGA